MPEPGWLISHPSAAGFPNGRSHFRSIFLLILLNLSVPLAWRANPRLHPESAALLGRLGPTSLDGFLPGHARMVVVDGASPCALLTSSQQYTWIDSYRPCVSRRNLSSPTRLLTLARAKPQHRTHYFRLRESNSNAHAATCERCPSHSRYRRIQERRCRKSLSIQS